MEDLFEDLFKDPSNPLWDACLAGNISAIRAILNGPDRATGHGLGEECECLVNSIINESKGVEGSKEVVRVLVEHGVNVNAPDPFGMSAVTTCASYDMIDLMKILLAHGGNLEPQGHPAPPLMWAAKHNQLKMVRLLLERGADVNASFEDRDWENTRGNTTVLLKAVGEAGVPILECLIAAGADLEARTFDHKTALHLAAITNNATAIRCLVNAGLPVDIFSTMWTTPLMLAARHGKAEAAAALLEAGADIHAKNGAGRTALHLASQSGNRKTIAILEYHLLKTRKSDHSGMRGTTRKRL